jgi:hypothetical protein
MWRYLAVAPAARRATSGRLASEWRATSAPAAETTAAVIHIAS